MVCDFVAGTYSSATVCSADTTTSSGFCENTAKATFDNIESPRNGVATDLARALTNSIPKFLFGLHASFF